MTFSNIQGKSLSQRQDFLKSLVTLGAMLEAVYFSILAEIPSGPLDFDMSRDFKRC